MLKRGNPESPSSSTRDMSWIEYRHSLIILAICSKRTDPLSLKSRLQHGLNRQAMMVKQAALNKGR